VLGKINVALVNQGGGVRFFICTWHDVDSGVMGSEVKDPKKSEKREERNVPIRR